MRKPVPGLFFTGTDTGVGKTHVAALVARELHARGLRVGVYKPAASGCELREGKLISSDAQQLWDAAGRPGTLEQVCPQTFAAPLAPHLAAKAEGRRFDTQLLRVGLQFWNEQSDVVIVEGAGGLMSPLGDEEYVADLAFDLALPVVVVAKNMLGVINQVLQTLIVAETFRDGLNVVGVVLNRTQKDEPADSSLADPSLATNRTELAQRAVAPILGEVLFQADHFDKPIDWMSLATAHVDQGLS